MDTKHTPGPLTARAGYAPHFQARISSDATGAAVAITYSDEGARNAERLVACWNACEGIADPASLRAQRDELLAALRALLAWAPTKEPAETSFQTAAQQARAAIARAEAAQ